MDTPSSAATPLTPDPSPTQAGRGENDNARSAEKNEQNIVVTGFMGTGKTTVGKRLAEILNRPFVDTDVEIVQRAGKPIPEIFAQDGESVFRSLERQLAAELAAQGGLVIATGGGMLVDEGNRALMQASAFVICLDTSPETIGQRLSRAHDRPLASNWQAVLEKRRESYAAIPNHIDTTDKTPDEIAQEIIQIWHSQ